MSKTRSITTSSLASSQSLSPSSSSSSPLKRSSSQQIRAHNNTVSAGSSSGLGASPPPGQPAIAPSTISHGSGKYDYLMKLIMIGDSGVGKSCLLIRFSEDTFTHSFISTVGIDFKIRTMQVGDKIVKLQIYDTAGQDRFRTITAAYYRGSHGIMLVYDVTDDRSFNNIRTWIAQMPAHTQTSVKMLIGNKCDLDDRRVVDVSRGQQLAKEFDFHFTEASAKTNANVEQAFYTIAKEIKSRIDQKVFVTDGKPDQGKVDIVSPAIAGGSGGAAAGGARGNSNDREAPPARAACSC